MLQAFTCVGALRKLFRIGSGNFLCWQQLSFLFHPRLHVPDAVMRYLLILFHVDAVWLCEDLLTALPADLLAAELGGRALQLMHLD